MTRLSEPAVYTHIIRMVSAATHLLEMVSVVSDTLATTRIKTQQRFKMEWRKFGLPF